MTRVELLWEAFKWLAECPGQEEGTGRKIGIFIYTCCLAASIILVVAMFQGSQSNHVGYDSEGGDSNVAVLHRLPDFVACPRVRISTTTLYNVEMNPQTVPIAGISSNELDTLAAMYFKNCPQGKWCDLRPFRVPCDGSQFQEYCRKLDAFFMTRRHFSNFDKAAYLADRNEETWIEMISPLDQAVALGIMKRRNSGRWTLEMLWTALINPGYGLIGDIVVQEVNITEYRNGLNCYFYSMTKDKGINQDKQMMIRQQEATKTIWFGKSLCMTYLGSGLPPGMTPFFGCQAFRFNRTFFPSSLYGMFEQPFRYWIGNMAVNILRENSFYLSYHNLDEAETIRKNTKLERITSGVVHYNMILSKDSTEEAESCIAQPLVKGMPIPCSRTGKKEETWYYELAPQTRGLHTVWVYGKTKTTIEKQTTFTSYTKFQFGAGIFGCLIGMSVAQILEALLLFSRKFIRHQKGIIILNGLRIILFTLLFFGSIALTVFDMSTYVTNRYSTVFSEKSSELEIPVCKLCPENNMDYSFLNRTKIAELNISLQLYGYLKYAGMFRHPMTNLITKTKKLSNGTWVREVPAWMIRNYRPPRKTIEKCNGYPTICERWQRPEYLDHYIPDRINYFPILYEDSREFFREMAVETRDLETKLGLPRNSPISDIIKELHLDPKQLIPHCRVQNQDIPNCWKYIKYTYIGQRINCLELKIPRKAITAKYDYGYENGLFLELNHEPYYRDSDVYAYYGPGVPEAKLNQQDSICNTGTQFLSPVAVSQGYKYEICSNAGGGWSFKIQLQSYSMDEIEYRYRPMLQPSSFSAEVRTGFKYNELASSCKDSTQVRTCRHPKEEFLRIVRSIHFEIQCSCSICYGTDFESQRKMLSSTTEILGHNAHCCTDTEFYDCFSQKLENVDWENLRRRYLGTLDKGQMTKKTLYVVKAFRKEPDYDTAINFIWSTTRVSREDALDSADNDKIKTLFDPRTYERLSNASSEKLVQFAKSCFKEPCKVETLELMSLQPKPSAGNVSSIAIFYSTNIAYGMEIIDMFDPVQLAGTLVAGYSATFGISILGLVELIILIVSNWKNLKNDSTAAKLAGRQHILKSLSKFVTDGIKNRQTRPNNNQIEEIPAELSDAKESKDDSSDASKVMHVSKTDQISMKKVSCLEKATENPKPKNSEALESNKDPEEMTPPSGNNKGSLLVSITTLLFLVSIFLIGYFFFTFSNVVFDGRISEAKSYEPPSIVLCVEEQKMVKPLTDGLAESSCSTHDGSFGCGELFQTFFRNRQNRFCVMLDNSRKLMVADETMDDLVMKVPDDFPPVMVGAVSLNRTSLEEIFPFTEWKDQHAVISYAINLRESQDGTCLSEIETKTCERCPDRPEYIKNPSICCFGPKVNEPAITLRQTCSQYSFGARISPLKKEANEVGRSLFVKVTRRNMMVYSIKTKYSFVYYVSIVGGFIGSFIELTLLNLIAAAILAGFRLLRNLAG